MDRHEIDGEKKLEIVSVRMGSSLKRELEIEASKLEMPFGEFVRQIITGFLFAEGHGVDDRAGSSTEAHAIMDREVSLFKNRVDCALRSWEISLRKGLE